MTKHFAVSALIMFFLISLASAQAPSAMADWLIDRSGSLVQIDGSILGDDDESMESEQDDVEDERGKNFSDDKNRNKEVENKRQESQREQEKTRLETERELKKQKLETQIEARKKIQEKTKQQSEYKIRSENGEMELEQEVKNEAGKLLKKQELKLGDEPLRLESGDDGEMVRINAVKDGRLEMVKNRIRTSTDLELKVDDKNALSVTLPNGKVKEVNLPDQALEKLVANGIITQIDGSENAYKLTAKPNGDVVYSDVEGEVEKKILGFKLKFKQKMEVAAGDSEDGTYQSGDIISSESQETSPWRKFLERLAK